MRCGPNGPVDLKGEILAMPAPDDLSDYGKLNEMRKELVDRRVRSMDEYEVSRLNILIANIDGLKVNPDDKALLEQFAKNTADLERYKAGRV
jgi:hypothetical protein